MMDGSDGMSYAGFWLMLLVAVVSLVLLGALVYLALRAANPQPPASAGTVGPVAPSPREVLDLRLARGEISPEEYSTARPLLDP